MDKRLFKMYVFYCSNSLEQDQLNGAFSGVEGISVKAISLPCSGKVNIPYLMKTFEAGADGVVIVTCKQGQCQHIEGNLRAEKRAQAVESLLEEIGMEKGRMSVIMLKDGGVEQLIEEIKDFFVEVKKLPQQQGSTVI